MTGKYVAFFLPAHLVFLFRAAGKSFLRGRPGLPKRRPLPFCRPASPVAFLSFGSESYSFMGRSPRQKRPPFFLWALLCTFPLYFGPGFRLEMVPFVFPPPLLVPQIPFLLAFPSCPFMGRSHILFSSIVCYFHGGGRGGDPSSFLLRSFDPFFLRLHSFPSPSPPRFV